MKNDDESKKQFEPGPFDSDFELGMKRMNVG